MEGLVGWPVAVLSPATHPHPRRDPQRQQGPPRVLPDPPVGRLPRGPGPSPHDRRRTLPADGPAGWRPGLPPAPRPSPLAAPHPQPLPVDGGPLLRSVLPRQARGQSAGVGQGRRGAERPLARCRRPESSGPGQTGLPTPLCLTAVPCVPRPWAPCPTPEPAPRLLRLRARLHALRLPPVPGQPCTARHPALGAHPPHRPPRAW